MKFLVQFLKVLLILTAALALGFYVFFLFALPNIMSLPDNVHIYEGFISKKIGVPVSFKNLRFKTHPDLSFEAYTDSVYIVPQKNVELFHSDKIKYGANIFDLKHGHLSAKYLYADMEALRKYVKLPSGKGKKTFDFSFFPQTNISSAQIKFNDKNYLDVDYVKSKKHKGKIITKLLAHVYSEYSKEPVTIGENGLITFKNHFGFEEFSVKFPKASIYLTGNRNGMRIFGKNLPVRELENSFLYFYKLRNSNKRNFLENFSDFKGTMDVDLFSDKKGLTGKCITHNLGAKFSEFKVDVLFPKTVFDFRGREVSASTKGIFGTEPVQTDFHLTGMLTNDLDVRGNVYSVFQNRLTKKYFPAVEILGKTPAMVKYHTHNQSVDVHYILTAGKGSNLMSQWGNLDNTDKNRVISMHTSKNGNKMLIKDWDYSLDGTKILSGEGSFEKINGRYTLSDLSVKTAGKISVDYVKSFLRDNVSNGKFDADLQIYFLKKVLLGTANFYNISHEDFLYLKDTSIDMKPDEIKVLSEGSFYGSPLRMSVRAKNHFGKDILIHSIDVRLKEYYLKKGKMADINESFTDGKCSNKKAKNGKMQLTVEQGRVIADRIYSDSFDVRNVNIQGALKNNIASFIIPKADYAKGMLSAKGLYNLSDYSSDIWFYASDIDSNIVLTEFFHLPNQIEGTAYATLHAITRNKLNDVKADATFAISNGYMPQIAEKEIFIGRKRADGKKKGLKLTLSRIINLDFTDVEDYMTNIYGSFKLDNDTLRDLRMFSKSEWLGLYFEGMYNIPSECGNLYVWGKRNKTHAKGIRIFKIPINLLYRLVFKPEHSASRYEEKIKLIPRINEKITDDIAIFRVKVLGYFNRKGGLKFELNDLR